MDAEKALREAHQEACVMAPGCHWPDYHQGYPLCVPRHRSIDLAVQAAYLRGGHDEAHGRKQPKWLPTERGQNADR